MEVLCKMHRLRDEMGIEVWTLILEKVEEAQVCKPDVEANKATAAA
jgi:hypothetical protein